MEPPSPREGLLSLVLPLGLILGLVLLLALDSGEPPAATREPSAAEAWIEPLVNTLAAGTEMAAACVIGAAVVGAVLALGRVLLNRKLLNEAEEIRLQLGRLLTLGLEFTVASDILRTAVAPTRQSLLNLGAIVLLRTLLNYFLEQEIRQGEERRARTAPHAEER